MRDDDFKGPLSPDATEDYEGYEMWKKSKKNKKENKKEDAKVTRKKIVDAYDKMTLKQKVELEVHGTLRALGIKTKKFNGKKGKLM
jgi:hypothetical protein